MYDIVVVGAGFAGSIIAREYAEKGKKVLVVDRRNHIAGNCYDKYDENGILIQVYGPHFFITSDWDTMEYLMKYSEFYEYSAEAVSYIDGKYIARPYNMRSLQQLLGPQNTKSILNKLRDTFKGKHRVTLYELQECSDPEIKKVAELLHDKVFAPYISKQWDLKVEDLDPSVVNRAVFVLGYDTVLEDADYQYLPKYGYTHLFESILDHENIEVDLGVEANSKISFTSNRARWNNQEIKGLFYTGSIDELFGFKYGELPYRGRRFTYNSFNEKQLEKEVVSYPSSDFDYIRRTEFKQFNPCKRETDITVVQNEFSTACIRNKEYPDEPYYPVTTENTQNLYRQYMQLADRYENFYVCGRLGQYRYFDMDMVVREALSVVGESEGTIQ